MIVKIKTIYKRIWYNNIKLTADMMCGYKASLYNNEFYILHDIFHKGNQVAFNKKDFITLREYRKNKINNILQKIWTK